MSTLAKVGLVLAILFVLANVFGLAYAAVHREVAHSAIHIVLLIPGMLVVSRLTDRRETDS